jgi:hypothetical protein
MVSYAYLRISAEDVPLNIQGGQPLPVPGGGRVVAVLPDFEGETELLVEVPVPGADSQAFPWEDEAGYRAWAAFWEPADGTWPSSLARASWLAMDAAERYRWIRVAHAGARAVPPDGQDGARLPGDAAEAGTRQDEPDAPLRSLVTTLDDLMQRWLREADAPGFELRAPISQRHARELAERIEPHARMLEQ